MQGVQGGTPDMQRLTALVRPAKRLCTGRLPQRTFPAPVLQSVAVPERVSQVPARVSTLSPPELLQQGAGQLAGAPASARPAQQESLPIAYELVSGALVKWSVAKPSKPPPTAVLVHGVLGSRKNVASFAQRLVQAFPSWQVLLVDVRCHGESSAVSLGKAPHTINTAAADILALLSRLRLFPQALIGHSMGGKVVMTMAEQFSTRAATLPRPVQVWVLDALPGDVRAGANEGRQDHPADLITALQRMSLPLPNRSYLQAQLTGQGFSPPIARWASTNLRPINGDHRKLTWSFDLPGIDDLYKSYEATDMWRFLRQPAQGITVHFVRAQRSVFKWTQPVVDQIQTLGHQGSVFKWTQLVVDRIQTLGHQGCIPVVHFLDDSGHWCHTDNPAGLLQIMAPSLSSAKH